MYWSIVEAQTHDMYSSTFYPETKNFKSFCGQMFQHIHNLKFIHVFAGWAGRSADGSGLKPSLLSQTQLMDNNSEYVMDTYHILG